MCMQQGAPRQALCRIQHRIAVPTVSDEQQPINSADRAEQLWERDTLHVPSEHMLQHHKEPRIDESECASSNAQTSFGTDKSIRTLLHHVVYACEDNVPFVGAYQHINSINRQEKSCASEGHQSSIEYKEGKLTQLRRLDSIIACD